MFEPIEIGLDSFDVSTEPPLQRNQLSYSIIKLAMAVIGIGALVLLLMNLRYNYRKKSVEQ